MHTVNNRTQLICCVYILYKAGELIITQPYISHATSVAIYPLGTHVVRTSATEHAPPAIWSLVKSRNRFNKSSVSEDVDTIGGQNPIRSSRPIITLNHSPFDIPPARFMVEHSDPRFDFQWW